MCCEMKNLVTLCEGKKCQQSWFSNVRSILSNQQRIQKQGRLSPLVTQDTLTVLI